MTVRRIGLVGVVVSGLLALSSVAMAEEDTVLNYGYDPDNHFLLINLAPLSPLDTTEACEPSTDTETDYTISDGTVDLADTEGCSVQAIDVTGPAGQINQGMFMKAFNSFLDTLDLEYGRGCLVRHLAQSGLGIDNQIRTPDADPDFEADMGGSAQFSTVIADCEHGNGNGNGEDASAQGKPEWAGQGPPPWAGQGRPDSPGNSAAAPGRAGK